MPRSVLRFASPAPFCQESPKASPGLNVTGPRQARQLRSKEKKPPTIEAAPISLEDDADVVVAPLREEHPLTKVDRRPLCEKWTPRQKLGKQNLQEKLVLFGKLFANILEAFCCW